MRRFGQRFGQRFRCTQAHQPQRLRDRTADSKTLAKLRRRRGRQAQLVHPSQHAEVVAQAEIDSLHGQRWRAAPLVLPLHRATSDLDARLRQQPVGTLGTSGSLIGAGLQHQASDVQARLPVTLDLQDRLDEGQAVEPEFAIDQRQGRNGGQRQPGFDQGQAQCHMALVVEQSHRLQGQDGPDPIAPTHHRTNVDPQPQSPRGLGSHDWAPLIDLGQHPGQCRRPGQHTQHHRDQDAGQAQASDVHAGAPTHPRQQSAEPPHRSGMGSGALTPVRRLATGRPRGLGRRWTWRKIRFAHAGMQSRVNPRLALRQGDIRDLCGSRACASKPQ